ncbi:MAG: EI24 domain-containing protein [Rhodoferax sp.]
MNLLFDSFWRAAAYCLRPRIILFSLLPLVLAAGATLGLGYFLWEPAIDLVRALLESLPWSQQVWAWMEGIGLGAVKAMLVPLIVVFTATPLIVMATLLLVAAFMGSAIARLVAQRRFASLEECHSGALWRGLAWSLGSTLMALLALLVSMPLWFVPPLILLIPPLIWGWLTYRVMAYDALSVHATVEERRTLFKRHRMTLLGMGVVVGFLGGAPSLLWVSWAVFAAAFVVLAPLAIWIYTLVFVFASLWFAHFCLAALSILRDERRAQENPVAPVPGDVGTDAPNPNAAPRDLRALTVPPISPRSE